jgi:predicted nucleic acid-binding protein
MSKLAIQQMIKNGDLELVWSDVLDLENNDNPYEERQTKIAKWKNLASVNVEINDAITAKTEAYMKIGLKQMDAAHIASAVWGGSEYFITVDKKIFNKPIAGIIVVSPVSFLWRLQNAD